MPYRTRCFILQRSNLPHIISIRCDYRLCFSILGNIFLTSDKNIALYFLTLCVCACMHVCTKTVYMRACMHMLLCVYQDSVHVCLHAHACMCVPRYVIREQFLEVSPPFTTGLRYPTQIFTLAVSATQ